MARICSSMASICFLSSSSLATLRLRSRVERKRSPTEEGGRELVDPGGSIELIQDLVVEPRQAQILPIHAAHALHETLGGDRKGHLVFSRLQAEERNVELES